MDDVRTAVLTFAVTPARNLVNLKKISLLREENLSLLIEEKSKVRLPHTHTHTSGIVTFPPLSFHFSPTCAFCFHYIL